MTLQPATRQPSSSGNLVELLDRVLDKGLVVIGDIGISVAGVELLTLRIRLLVVSLDRAEELGLDLSWAGIDQSKIGPAEERPALAGAPARGRRGLAAPAEKRALDGPSSGEDIVIPTAALERLHHRLGQLERRLARRTARKVAACPTP
jgi:hypothetical protein